jgi:hypothetical protein
MLTKYSLFLLIAVYFVFSYPVISRNWNLNYSIGLYGRDWKTYLLPIWFFIVFLTYRKMASQKAEASDFFFWLHIAVTVIPTFYFNHPFIKTYSERTPIEDAVRKMNRVHLAFLLYMVVQVLFYVFLLIKLFRR